MEDIGCHYWLVQILKLKDLQIESNTPLASWHLPPDTVTETAFIERKVHIWDLTSINSDGSTKYSTRSDSQKVGFIRIEVSFFPSQTKSFAASQTKFILSGNLVHDKKPPMNWSASSSYHSTPGLFNVKFQLCRLDQLSDEHENLFFISPVIYSTL